MAEFCRECAIKRLKFSEGEMRRAKMSEEPDLCEGCGQWKPVLIGFKPTPHDRYQRLMGRKRDKWR